MGNFSYNKDTERPSGGYMLPETKMMQAKARRKAEELGLVDRPYRQYVNVGNEAARYHNTRHMVRTNI